MIRKYFLYPLLIVIPFACSRSTLRYESIESNRVRVFVTYDLYLLSKEEMDDDLIEKKLRILAILRAEAFVQAKAYSIGIPQQLTDSYITSTKDSLHTVKIYDSQSGDKITAGYDIDFPGLQNFFAENFQIPSVQQPNTDLDSGTLPIENNDDN